MSKGLLVALCASVGLLALIAGCGGGDSTDSGAPLTKAEFIKQGDAICKEGNEESRPELEEFADEQGFEVEKMSKAQLEEAVTQVLVPNLEQQAEELDALEPPVSERAEVKAIIDSLEEATAEIKKAPSEFVEGTPLAKTIRLENAYGFKACGGG